MNRSIKRLIKRSLDIGYAIVNPQCWISVAGSSFAADQFILKVMKEDLVYDVDGYVAITKDQTEIWIANYPYSYGGVYLAWGGPDTALPYRRARARFRKYIENKLVELSISEREKDSQ